MWVLLRRTNLQATSETTFSAALRELLRALILYWTSVWTKAFDHVDSLIRFRFLQNLEDKHRVMNSPASVEKDGTYDGIEMSRTSWSVSTFRRTAKGGNIDSGLKLDASNDI